MIDTCLKARARCCVHICPSTIPYGKYKVGVGGMVSFEP